MVNLDDLYMYSLTDLEPVLGVTHQTLTTYVKKGLLKASKIGGRWRVKKEDLERFIEENSNMQKEN